MKIQTIELDGYKNLNKIHLSFDKITALLSLNNFGKSNVLSGIDFGLSLMKAGAESKQEYMSHKQLIPLNPQTRGKNYRFRIEVLTEFQDEQYRVQYGYAFSWRKVEKVEKE